MLPPSLYTPPWPPGGPPSTPVPPQVHDLCDNFCHRYITCLKGKMPIDLVIEDRDGGCREDLEDYPASCPSLPDQVGQGWCTRHHPATKAVSRHRGATRAHTHTRSLSYTHTASDTAAQTQLQPFPLAARCEHVPPTQTHASGRGAVSYVALPGRDPPF